MTVYPLNDHDLTRVLDCARDFISRTPEGERELIIEGARQAGIGTEIHVDLTDPTDVPVSWLGRVILIVPRHALPGDEPLTDWGELPAVPDYPPE